MKKVLFLLFATSLVLYSCSKSDDDSSQKLDDRLVNTKWQCEDIVANAFYGKTCYNVYEFISETEVENYTVKNGQIISTYGTCKYKLNYPKLDIIKNDTTTYSFNFKDSKTIIRTGNNVNEYAAYMKYFKQ